MKTIALGLVVLLLSCKREQDIQATRTFKMGFQNSAPRFDSLNLFLETLKIWTARSDAAIISSEVPWKELLNGEKAEAFVVNNYKELAAFYRSKNFELWVYIDPQNGLDRTSDAVALQAAGKSIAQGDMQALYRRFVVVMDSVLQPEHIGLALETNLIRTASSQVIYNGVKQAVNDAAFDLKSRNTKARLSVSIQADLAWGKMTGGSYQGIAKDFEDFPFMQEIGISSYPYFVFDSPKDIPSNYYSRLIEGKQLPVFVSEGGWSSRSLTTPERSIVSSDQTQKEYILKNAELLNSVKATAVFQLVFTDIDLSSLPANVPANLAYFAWLGLVDSKLQPKPALGTWDEIFAKARK